MHHGLSGKTLSHLKFTQKNKTYDYWAWWQLWKRKVIYL